MIYDRVKALCDDKGIAISRLEKEANIGNKTIIAWKENDNPRAKSLEKVADYFGVSIDYLVRGDSNARTDER